jgi:hypothetical protein
MLGTHKKLGEQARRAKSTMQGKLLLIGHRITSTEQWCTGRSVPGVRVSHADFGLAPEASSTVR